MKMMVYQQCTCFTFTDLTWRSLKERGASSRVRFEEA